MPGRGYFETDKTFDLFAPRIGATYTLNDRLNLYATLAQSDQVPSESEIKDNPELNAATARNLETGLKGRAPNWDFDLALYYTQVEDEIVSQFLDGETKFQNAGETDKKGLELAGNLRLFGHLWLGASYAYSDYTFENLTELVNGRPVDRSGNRFPYVPRHQYSLSADYCHPSGFKARIQADTWGEYYMDDANTEKYEGYDLVTSLMLGYDKGPHSLSFNVDNLFDDYCACAYDFQNADYCALVPLQHQMAHRVGDSIAQGTSLAQGLLPVGITLATFLVLFVLLNKAFCGWVCPLGLFCGSMSPCRKQWWAGRVRSSG